MLNWMSLALEAELEAEIIANRWPLGNDFFREECDFKS
jgi:hypothetical protein